MRLAGSGAGVVSRAAPSGASEGSTSGRSAGIGWLPFSSISLTSKVPPAPSSKLVKVMEVSVMRLIRAAPSPIRSPNPKTISSPLGV